MNICEVKATVAAHVRSDSCKKPRGGRVRRSFFFTPSDIIVLRREFKNFLQESAETEHTPKPCIRQAAV
ncbi:hypothetical protein SETIT_5G423100v2 [Setaria italica]|uniref:Uncharacterized protein n=1 Tax=Setaria italica TaxID=4555 RepID=A0A368RER8_SETIT|nr:hypothetical protein SETIT_5G423100v2 [Setaria italica]